MGVTDTAERATVIRGDCENFHLKFTELALVTAIEALIRFSFSELSIL